MIAFSGKTVAQTINSSQGGGTYIQFNNAADLANGGVSLGNIQIQFQLEGGQNVPNWKLTVQVTSPIFINGTALDPQYVSVQHNPSMASIPTIANAIQAPSSYVPLSFSEVVLIQSAAYPLKSPPDYSFNLRYNLRIQGGNHLVELQNGSFPVALIFRLYDGNGVLKSSSSTTYGFGKWFEDSGAGGSNPIRTVTLVNGGQSVNLSFDSDDDYLNGVSKLLANSLRVQGQNPYQIKVKAMTDLVGSAGTIPVSIVSLESSAGNLAPTGTYSTLKLSTLAQPLLRKTGWTNPNPVYYNLRYFIKSEDSNSLQSRSGTYTTNLVFSIESN